jgi:hypothetical protein
MTSERFRAYARILFWCALVGATTLAIMPQPPHLPTDGFGDKFNHILAFTVMAGLAWLGWPGASRLRIVGGLSLLGALIEVVQAIPMLHRDCDVRDWLADTAAILVVTGAMLALSRRKAANPGQ